MVSIMTKTLLGLVFTDLLMGVTNSTKTTSPAWYTSLDTHTLCRNEHVPVSLNDTNCDTGLISTDLKASRRHHYERTHCGWSTSADQARLFAACGSIAILRVQAFGCHTLAGDARKRRLEMH
jgi:hypothetical protein